MSAQLSRPVVRRCMETRAPLITRSALLALHRCTEVRAA